MKYSCEYLAKQLALGLNCAAKVYFFLNKRISELI
jgi:hypothetical protein